MASPNPKKVIHILGLICGYLACVGLIIAGIVEAAKHMGSQHPGKYIVFGIAMLAATIVATVDGARAFPQLGIWRIGAKFEGVGDLAVIVIAAIIGIGFGVSLAF